MSFKEKSIDSIIYPDGQEGIIQHEGIQTKQHYKFIYLDWNESDENKEFIESQQDLKKEVQDMINKEFWEKR